MYVFKSTPDARDTRSLVGVAAVLLVRSNAE